VPREIFDNIEDDLRKPISPYSLLAFLSIYNDALEDPIYVVSDPTDFIVDGRTYIGVPFDISITSDGESAPTAQLRIQNVTREIGDAVQSAVGRISVHVAIRSTMAFDLTVIPRVDTGSGSGLVMEFDNFELIDVTVNDIEVSGTLMLRDYSQEPWPSGRTTKARCPALW
jgi:hypothetical protein